MNLQQVGNNSMKKQSDTKITEEPKKESDDWKGKYLRALADYQNLEKRSREMVDESRKFASEVMLLRLIPVVDTFKKAKEHIHDIGFDLAYKELTAVLAEQGVTTMQSLGKQFNPHEMECIEVVPGNDNEVMEELLPGYLFRGKVLRVAQVKVGKKNN